MQGSDVVLHFNRNEEQAREIQDVIACDSCGKEEMELDGDVEQYFAFSKAA